MAPHQADVASQSCEIGAGFNAEQLGALLARRQPRTAFGRVIPLAADRLSIAFDRSPVDRVVST